VTSVFDTDALGESCSCGEAAEPGSVRCAACHERDREYHRSLVRSAKASSQRRDERGRFSGGYDPPDWDRWW
jgi:hypothetical protein